MISDYPSPSILETIEDNVRNNIPESMRSSVLVKGHEWGSLTDAFSTANAGHFTRILCADCLWMDGEHQALVQSMLHFLSPCDDARIWVIAGFHTGRAKVVAFFDVAYSAGLEADKMWERDTDGHERDWGVERNGVEEDVEQRKRWLVVAILRRVTISR